MNKILFLDIDGVVLPGRAYLLPHQTRPIVKMFDPCAVALLNNVCNKMDYKIVIHSSWVKLMDEKELKVHLYEQGINLAHLHTDWYCDPMFHWRWDRVRDWLSRHKECEAFVILDDEHADDTNLIREHLIQTDFDEGITMEISSRLQTEEFKR